MLIRNYKIWYNRYIYTVDLLVNHGKLGVQIINATNFKINNSKLENEILQHINIDDLVEKYGIKSNAIVGKAYG